MSLITDIIDVPTQRVVSLLNPIALQSAIDAIVAAQVALSGKNLVRASSSYRTFATQNKTFMKGRKLVNGVYVKVGSVVTNARGGQSYHNYGLALDFLLRHLDGKVSWSTVEDMDGDGVADWMEVVNQFKLRGWAWGGEWNSIKDKPHVEYIPSAIADEAERQSVKPWKVLLQMYNAGKIDTAGRVVLV